MIKRLIRQNEEQSLARLAIVLPLASLCYWIPTVVVLAPLQLFLREEICGVVLLVFFMAWPVYIGVLWFRAIKVIRQAKVRETSPAIFHVLQIFSIVWAICAIFPRDLGWDFLTQWLAIMDVALAIFYLSYFLLALVTLTKIPWHATTGCGIVFLSLIYATSHNPFHNFP